MRHLESKGKIRHEGEQERLKIAGWILLLEIVAVLLMDGKWMLVFLVSVPLEIYAIYLRYYPELYMEATTQKGLSFPKHMMMALCIAELICMIFLEAFYIRFGALLKTTLCITAILAVPYMIRSAMIKEPQSRARKASVILAVLALSFSIGMPLNVLLTFDKPVHETIYVAGKYTGGSYRRGISRTIYGYRNGEKIYVDVSKDTYQRTSVGDRKRLCIRRSALGLEYYTIHD